MEDPDSPVLACPREFYEFTTCIITAQWMPLRTVSLISQLCRDTYLLLHDRMKRAKAIYERWSLRLARGFCRARMHPFPSSVRTHIGAYDTAYMESDGPILAIPGTDTITAPQFASIRRITILATRPYAFWLFVFGDGIIPAVFRVARWHMRPHGETDHLRFRQPHKKTPPGAYVSHVDMPVAHPLIRSSVLFSYIATRTAPGTDWTVQPDLDLTWSVITHIIVVHEQC